jgi:hypothetical protein
MASSPTPQSFQQTLGNMLTTFSANFGLPQLKVGSPILRILQSAAQSVFRSTNNVFTLLRNNDINQTTGQALINAAAKEGLTPIPETPATGAIRVTDTTFSKISTKIYPGTPSPVVGTTVIFVIDASTFPGSGSLYLGRDTTNYEGPIAYTSTANLGTYWSITLSAGTAAFHNLNESVVLAQGGNRSIPSGTVAQTPQGNTQSASQFVVLYNATIPDGEIVVENVQVVAKQPGLSGNIPANTITSFVNAPFSGAVPTNPQPFTNAKAQETENALRERVIDIRQSRSQGTPLAITTGVLGIQAPDEAKTITSAAIYTAPGQPTTLIIDDGTGYEEKDQGVAFETVVSVATGTEQYFKISTPPPVAKAFLATGLSAPFAMQNGAQLAVEISGVVYTHTFSTVEFASIANATAYEVAASINSDTASPFAARTYSNATKVAIFAKQNTDESLQVKVPTGLDANTFLGFSTATQNTLNLFKNDILLNKDGRRAIVTSNVQSRWVAVASPQTFIVDVDGTGLTTYTFTDQDFINANTGFITLNSQNSLASWAAVFNAKIPGITATTGAGTLILTSNLGLNGRALLNITGGGLVTGGKLFNIGSAAGADSDYVFDRNRGEGYLAAPLLVGDTLTLGTVDSRAYIQSTKLSTVTLATDAAMWLFVDGAATIIPTGITTLNPITLAAYVLTPPDGSHVRVRATGAAGTFTNVLIGDWIIFADDVNIGASNLGAWRVEYVNTSTYAYVEFSRSVLTTPGALTTNSNGIVVVRSTAYPQRITIPAATNYTATSLASNIATQLKGAVAQTYRTNYLRLRTNTSSIDGDIALVAISSSASLIGVSTGNATSNISIKPASSASISGEFGTPNFLGGKAATAVSTTAITVSALATFGIKSNSQIVPVRNRPDIDTVSPGNLRSRFGNNVGYNSMVANTSGTTVNFRNAVLEEWLPSDYFYVAAPLAVGPYDNFTVLVDGDTSSKRYGLNVYRNAVPTTGTYGLTNAFLDVDNSNQSFSLAFGSGTGSFDFKDFTVYMKARAKSHNEAGDTTKTVLWRWWRYGLDGTNAQVSYVYPSLNNQTVAVTTIPTNGILTQVNVALASTNPRTGITVHDTTKIGLLVTASGSLFSLTYILNLPASSGSRNGANQTTLVLTIPAGGADHGLAINDVIYFKSADVNFASGLYTITNRAATTITYTEIGPAVGATPNVGTVSNDISGEATTTGSTAINGHIFSVLPASSLPAYAAIPVHTTTLAAGKWVGLAPTGTAPFTTVLWYGLASTSNLIVFPLDSGSNTSHFIAQAANTLAAVANSTCPVTAVGVGVGGVSSGIISLASYEEFTTPAYGYPLADGANYVYSQTNPADPSQNYTLTFKDAITASLATNSDWANENVRLAPTTMLNAVNYFNCPGVSGLFNAAEVTNSSRGVHLQLSSLTPGSTGSIQVQGGLANAAGGSVIGSPQTAAGAGLILTFNAGDAQGLAGNMWVELRNSITAPKNLFTATHQLNSISVGGLFTFQNAVSTAFWSKPISDITGLMWYFTKEGNYFAIRYADVAGSTPTLTGVAEADYLVISGANPSNNGTFSVIRVSNSLSTIWVEIPNGVEEVSSPTLKFIASGSIMPGDIFTLGSTSFGGTNNARRYVVATSYTEANGYIFSVDPAGVPLTSFGTPTVLGASSSLFSDYQGTPSKLVKQVIAISPNPSTGTLVDVRFDTAVGTLTTGNNLGTVMVASNKFGFPTTLSTGLDAYDFAVGLISQANKVGYGDPTQPTIYPGIIAADADVNIAGPIIKRITTALVIRVQNGLSTVDVINRVQSSVATQINNTGVGQNIAISSLIDAAMKVYGVTSVAISSPLFDPSDDLIAVQAFEKPYVIDINTDVLVTLAGI